MTEQQIADSGVVNRALGLLSDQVLTIVAVCLIGVVFSWCYTQTRKPYIPGTERRKLRLRTEAMLAGALASALLLSITVTGSAYAKVVVVAVLAPMSGMASPVLFDLFAGFVWPWIRAKLRKKLADHGVDDADDTPTLLKPKKPKP